MITILCPQTIQSTTIPEQKQNHLNSPKTTTDVASQLTFPLLTDLSLSVPLLNTRLGNLEASVDSTQPCKGCLLQIWPIVVVSHLQETKSQYIIH